MCFVSAVFDQWHPYVPPSNVPITPGIGTWPRRPVPPAGPPTVTEEHLRKLLETFWKAYEAAKEFDSLTGQPDCEDPEKAKLLDRVAELEERLAALEADRA